MTYFRRVIDDQLIEWKNSTNRKPLLVRGARQVGKSSSIRNLGKQFAHFLEINFETQTEVRAFFTNTGRPKEICEFLSAYYAIPIIKGETLLFFDEVQATPEVLISLRYFYEQMPELHVIAAGSLLEFAIQELPSYGVGRIRSLFVYPFSFREFLWAMNESKLEKFIAQSSPDFPMDDTLHVKALELFRRFLLIGGMPEAIQYYIQRSEIFEVQQIISDLLGAYQEDFGKYKSRIPSQRIREIFNAVGHQMGSKFIYSKAVEGLVHRQILEGLKLLILAGLVIPVTHSSANGLPLGGEINPRKQKMLLFDTGIYQRMLQLPLSQIINLEEISLLNKGKLAELSFGLEWLKAGNPFERESLYYWHRETASSNAEVDFVVSLEGVVVPVEVKAATKGSMQSMRLFLSEKSLKRGIRVSSENFGRVGDIDIYPLYGVSNIRRITLG